MDESVRQVLFKRNQTTLLMGAEVRPAENENVFICWSGHLLTDDN